MIPFQPNKATRYLIVLLQNYTVDYTCIHPQALDNVLSDFHRIGNVVGGLGLRAVKELWRFHLALGDTVAGGDEIVVDLLCDDGVLFVLWVIGHEIPYPRGQRHQFS